MLDASDNYVKGVVRAPLMPVATSGSGGAGASAGTVAVASGAGGGTGSAVAGSATSAQNGVARITPMATSASSGGVGSLTIQGLGTIANDDIRVIESVRYQPGEMGPNALTVLFIRLKSGYFAFFAAELGASVSMRSPFRERPINVARRRARVSGFLALTTQKALVRWYHGA